MRVLRSVWAYVVTGILVGILLIAVVYPRYPSQTVLSLGDALIVAALVGGLLHVREVSELFETLARKTLIQEEYLTKLGVDQLRNIRSLSLRLTVGKGVSKDSKHRWEDLEATIEREVFSKLPDEKNPNVGLYRSDYDEAIALKFLSLREALATAKIAIPEGSEHDPRLDSVRVRKHTTITTFEVVAPRADVEVECPYPLTFFLGEVPIFPDKERVKAWVDEDEASAKEVHLEEPKIKAGAVELNTVIPLKVKGSKQVWIKTEEWHNADDPRFVLNTMSFLTRGLTLAVSSDRPLRFGGGIFGIGREKPPKVMDNGISLRYESWLLEDNGYIIWWDVP